MLARLGLVIYALCAGVFWIAIFFGAWLSTASDNALPLIVLAGAGGLVWLCGRLVLFVFAGE